ncbi:MAG: GNAT family N-acetyltransferase [Proteobacteria bacterium]|nr:GNAT family N-acetyltransferase [Pseudomonadota bacterium]
MSVTISVETPHQDDVHALIAELNTYLDSFLGPEAPAEFHEHMTIDDMAAQDTEVLVARSGREALGCCALRDRGDGSGEVKRMYVRPAARGQGTARAMLDYLRAMARTKGMSRLLLETGAMHHPARRLYQRFGFVLRPAFPPYWEDPHSVFYELPLT